jgi:hypothetical protein
MIGGTKMAEFPLEKILTISVEGYFKMNPLKDPRDYKPEGVHLILVEDWDHTRGISDQLKDDFARKVPENAEVVVDYVPSISVSLGGNYYKIGYAASGTALVPKKK